MVKPGLSLRIALPPCLLLLALVLPVCLSGCGGDAYSAAIDYGVRQDPLVLNEKLGPERYNPEPPGQLPLFSVLDLKDVRNPLHDGWQQLFQEGKLLDPSKLDSADRQELADALREYFGTLAQPRVGAISDLTRDALGLDEETLAQGSRLYRIHCVHCHGVTGDGRGPTAKWVHPHPRDYRQGLFKFQSVNQSDGTVRPPRREDLKRTLERGIEGTSMPTFALLPAHELDALVSYVIHLSIRGKAEYETIKNAFAYDPESDALTRQGEYGPSEYVKVITEKMGETWLEAQAEDKKIEVKPNPHPETAMAESVRRGQALFLADEANLKKYYPKVDINSLKAASCVSCHLDYGRRAQYKFDTWGTLVKPRDLTDGVYRGGRRPEDLYYRIHSGINGSGMAHFGKVLDNNQIWDLINFVRALPYPAMREKYGVAID